jgi:hypothetical protein
MGGIWDRRWKVSETGEQPGGCLATPKHRSEVVEFEVWQHNGTHDTGTQRGGHHSSPGVPHLLVMRATAERAPFSLTRELRRCTGWKCAQPGRKSPPCGAIGVHLWGQGHTRARQGVARQGHRGPEQSAMIPRGRSEG